MSYNLTTFVLSSKNSLYNEKNITSDTSVASF